MGDAKRVDLVALRRTEERLRRISTHEGTDPQADAIRDAIAEIEAARAAPAPSPPSGLADVPDRFGARLSVLAEAVVSAWDERSRSGPSRAERLVRYRCAALSGMLADPECDAGARGTAEATENFAHAMLAAEREPSS